MVVSKSGPMKRALKPGVRRIGTHHALVSKSGPMKRALKPQKMDFPKFKRCSLKVRPNEEGTETAAVAVTSIVLEVSKSGPMKRALKPCDSSSGW